MGQIHFLAGEAQSCREAAPGRAAVIEFVTGCTVSCFGAIGAANRSDRELLPENTRVHIPALPARSLEETIAAAKTLRREGFEPVPDLVAAAIAGPARLGECLARLGGEADVREVLLIGADVRGPDMHVLALLRSGVFEACRVARIGIAAHPAGRLRHGDLAVHQGVAAYNQWAQRCAASVYFLTRPWPDPAALFAWEMAAQRAGNVLPVRVGIAAPGSPARLAGLERLCGLQDVPDEQADPVLRVALTGPNRMVAAMAQHRRAHPGCALAGAHFLASDGLRGTGLWLQAVLRGDFGLDETGMALAVYLNAAA